jgi:hypothetical protein
MFINTSSRLTKFYTAHKTTIDTLILIAQLICYAIALLGLLSLLGWTLATSQAVAWMNKLVEDSLAKPHVYLLMPVDTLDTQSDDVPNVPSSDAILAEWRERAALNAPALAPVNEVAPQKENASPLHLLTIHELKKRASARFLGILT